MKRFFTLEYWQEDDWFVGKLREIPGIFSQGKTIEELKENIIDAYHMMLQDSNDKSKHSGVKYTELGVDV
jgi:predicted RNase H-like HicB family nuclease